MGIIPLIILYFHIQQHSISGVFLTMTKRLSILLTVLRVSDLIVLDALISFQGFFQERSIRPPEDIEILFQSALS